MKEEDDRPSLVRIAAFFREHPALLGTLLYLQVNAVGVTYSWALFREFDVNVFDFAEANDFLLAAFRQPLALVQSAITFAMLGGYLAIAWYRYHKRESQQRRRMLMWLTMMMALSVVPYTLFPAYAFAKRDAARLREATAPELTIQLCSTGGPDSQPMVIRGALIGTTERFLFLYMRDQSQISVLPVASLYRVDSVESTSEAEEEPAQTDQEQEQQ